MPPRFLISYDMNDRGRNYRELYDFLHDIGAQRVLESVWILRRDQVNAASLCEQIESRMDVHDQVLVSCMDGDDTTGHNLWIDPAAF